MVEDVCVLNRDLSRFGLCIIGVAFKFLLYMWFLSEMVDERDSGCSDEK